MIEDLYGIEDLPELDCVENPVDGVPYIRTELRTASSGNSIFSAYPIKYACSDEDDEDVKQLFTRYCTTKYGLPDNTDTQFQCNEMAETTDYGIFLNLVEEKQECPNESGTYTMLNSQASFAYPLENTISSVVFGNYDNSPTFSPAKDVIFVLYESLPETATPTSTPTTSLMPSAAPSSPASSFQTSNRLLVAASIVVAGTWMMM